MSTFLKTNILHFCMTCIPRVIKEIPNEKPHFDEHLKTITCKELIIQFYHNQDGTLFLFL